MLNNKELETLFISPNIVIKDAIKQLDETAKKILLVVDEMKKLYGTITDGDIRRWILNNGSLEDNVSKIMYKNCRTVQENQRSTAYQIMKNSSVMAIPVVNKDYEVVDIIFLENKDIPKVKKNILNNKVVVMAGGKGTRLFPYTQILPKPLIPIGEKTIIEHIFKRFNTFGCKDFLITVNYKKNLIKSYLEEIYEDYSYTYVEEEDFYGTAGSLSLLKGKLTETFFVTNCDILIDADYEDIINEHKKNNNKITVVTSLHNFVVPYGIIESGLEGEIIQLKEKPEYNFQVNTGVYVLEPEVLNDIPENTFFHITDLINDYVKNNKKVGIYPIRAGQWLDMGEISLMEEMKHKLENMEI